MSYIQGFLAAVPVQNKADYVACAQKSWEIFRDYGALSMLEAWEDNAPDDTLTSFPMAVKRNPGKAVVFSQITWRDKADADACFAAMESDPRWQTLGEMPFDGKRMIWGFFRADLRRTCLILSVTLPCRRAPWRVRQSDIQPRPTGLDGHVKLFESAG